MTNPFEDEKGVYHVLINEEGSIPFGRLSKRCRSVGPLRSSPTPAPPVLSSSIRIGKTCGPRVWLSGWKSRPKAKNQTDRSISGRRFW